MGEILKDFSVCQNGNTYS